MMTHSPAVRSLAGAALIVALVTFSAHAGPPYFTDDPEPVDEHHWEFYLASQTQAQKDDHSGTLPHVEVNYGAYKDLQLHIIAPLSYDQAAREDHAHHGYGDTELGAKWRFLHETDWLPQIATFP